MTQEKINLYPEAKATLMVLFITDHRSILSELRSFAKEHLLFLRDNGLVDQTMEVITEEGLFYIELLKEELTNLEVTTNDSDTKLARCLGSHFNTYLIHLYLLGKASIPPSIIHTPEDYLDILANEFNLLTDFDYELNSNGLRVLCQIGKQMEIKKDKAEIQQIVDDLSYWQALTLKAVSEKLAYHKKVLPHHKDLYNKGLISSDYDTITKKGIGVLLRHDELRTRELRKLLNAK